MPPKPVRVVILSGLSGSGKSTAIRSLEDIGFFCIDNLPIVLLPKVLELFPGTSDEIEQIALVVDARESRFLDGFKENIDRIKQSGSQVGVLFLECSDKVLIRRYQETRRRHPLAKDGTVQEGIEKERVLLQELKETADYVFDTSDLNPHQLRRIVKDHYMTTRSGHEMILSLVSFGYRHGFPAQADLIFDVRFLPNPYFVPELKELNGKYQQVSDYVLEHSETEVFLKQVVQYVTTFKPYYEREGKSCLTVGVGCTGGQHRSVAIVEELGKRLGFLNEPVVVRHRELAKSRNL
jgi:UPF0042 nucleotide-binding protein